ncbi:ATP-binding protein [Streptomyces sp. NPDC020681]|uniref:ATP-binding protein n=1 Tax=Streptomyces sp. NPDC020681 TaxID=3365083 RepID=UPI00379320D8
MTDRQEAIAMYARTLSLTAQTECAATTHQPGAVAASTWDGRGTPTPVPVVRQPRIDEVDNTTWTLPHRPQAAGAARKITAAVLDDWHVDEETSEVALLVVSELVTNAVTHAQAPLALHLIREPDQLQLRVEVVDGGPAIPKGRRTACCEPDEHGRGLNIVDAVATSHGTRVHAHGATHWACLPTCT